MNRINHRWTEDELEIVRRDYAGTNESARAIAHRLGVTLFAVKGQVQKLGIAKITDRCKWDPAQDKKLRELIEQYPISLVAKKMKRSKNAVAMRVKRLGLSRRDRFDWYTKREVCEILGVDHKWVQTRIDSGSLPAISYYGGRVGQLGLSAWQIQRTDLRAFIRRYPEELNGRNVDLITVVDILCGLDISSH